MGVYYTDSEIYCSIRRGVSMSILAQLNGCAVAEIRDIYNRHKASIELKEMHYKQQLALHNDYNKITETPQKHVVPKKEVIHKEEIMIEEKSIARKFKYTDEIENMMRQKLAQGVKPAVIYDELFLNSLNSPNLVAFKRKCNEIKKDINVVDKVSSSDESIESLSKQREELREELQYLSVKYQETLTKIVEINLKINQLNQG